MDGYAATAFGIALTLTAMQLTQCVGLGTICKGTEFQYNSPPGSESCKQWEIPKAPEGAATVIEIDSEKSEGMVEFPDIGSINPKYISCIVYLHKECPVSFRGCDEGYIQTYNHEMDSPTLATVKTGSSVVMSYRYQDCTTDEPEQNAECMMDSVASSITAAIATLLVVVFLLVVKFILETRRASMKRITDVEMAENEDRITMEQRPMSSDDAQERFDDPERMTSFTRKSNKDSDSEEDESGESETEESESKSKHEKSSLKRKIRLESRCNYLADIEEVRAKMLELAQIKGKRSTSLSACSTIAETNTPSSSDTDTENDKSGSSGDVKTSTDNTIDKFAGDPDVRSDDVAKNKLEKKKTDTTQLKTTTETSNPGDQASGGLPRDNSMMQRDGADTAQGPVPSKSADEIGKDDAPKSRRGESNYVPVDEIRKKKAEDAKNKTRKSSQEVQRTEIEALKSSQGNTADATVKPGSSSDRGHEDASCPNSGSEIVASNIKNGTAARNASVYVNVDELRKTISGTAASNSKSKDDASSSSKSGSEITVSKITNRILSRKQSDYVNVDELRMYQADKMKENPTARSSELAIEKSTDDTKKSPG